MKTLALASTLALFAACTSSNDKSSSDITQDEYDDVAQSVGTSTTTTSGGGEVGAMADVVVIATGTLPLGFSLDASGKIDGSHLGVDYSYQVTCKDASGATLPACTNLTDSATASLSWSGNLTLPDFSSSVSRTGMWTVSGLQSSTASFGGNGTFMYDAMITNPARNTAVSYALSYDATYDAVLVDTATKLAIGGSIHYEIDATKDKGGSDTQTFSLSADVTFNADSTATIVLDGTHTYSLNLSTGVVVSVSN
jgi:hypothetical protein